MRPPGPSAAKEQQLPWKLSSLLRVGLDAAPMAGCMGSLVKGGIPMLQRQAALRGGPLDPPAPLLRQAFPGHLVPPRLWLKWVGGCGGLAEMAGSWRDLLGRSRRACGLSEE